MNRENLIPGFAFALEHNLNLSEMRVLVQLIPGLKLSVSDIATNLEKGMSTINALLQRLVLRKFVYSEKSNKKILYWINPEL
jgi:predicted transcriptional regulator